MDFIEDLPPKAIAAIVVIALAVFIFIHIIDKKNRELVRATCTPIDTTAMILKEDGHEKNQIRISYSCKDGSVKTLDEDVK